MPTSAPHPCATTGCAELVPRGRARCGAHERRASAVRRENENPNASYNNPRWRAFRAAWIADHPLCAECERAGRVTPARDVDHVEPWKGDLVKFWAGPFQSLCISCHSRKTALQDGGLGNAVRR